MVPRSPIFCSDIKDHEFDQAVINISLVIVVASIIISILISLTFPPSAKQNTEENDEDEHAPTNP